MAEPTEITPEMLGTFTTDDPSAPAPEAPKPEAEKPAAAPAEPAKPAEPTPPEEPAKPGDDDVESLTLEELTASISDSAKKAVAEAIEAERKRAADEDADSDTPPEVKKMREENARLAAEAEQAKKALAEREEAEETAKLQHSIASTVGKYKMTEAELDTVVKYMEANMDLVNGGVGFEEAALRRLPALADRLRTTPPPPEAPKASVLDSAPAATGPGAPTPFRHKPERGSYADVNKHILESGLAAQLGKHT